MFVLTNSSPNAQRNVKRAQEEPSLSATGGLILYEIYALLADISKMLQAMARD